MAFDLTDNEDSDTGPTQSVGANAKIVKMAGADRPSPTRTYTQVVRTGRAVNVEERARAR